MLTRLRETALTAGYVQAAPGGRCLCWNTYSSLGHQKPPSMTTSGPSTNLPCTWPNCTLGYGLRSALVSQRAVAQEVACKTVQEAAEEGGGVEEASVTGATDVVLEKISSAESLRDLSQLLMPRSRRLTRLQVLACFKRTVELLTAADTERGRVPGGDRAGTEAGSRAGRLALKGSGKLTATSLGRRNLFTSRAGLQQDERNGGVSGWVQRGAAGPASTSYDMRGLRGVGMQREESEQSQQSWEISSEELVSPETPLGPRHAERFMEDLSWQACRHRYNPRLSLQLLFCLSKLRYVHRPLMKVLLSCLHPGGRSFKALRYWELVTVLHSLSVLKIAVSPTWMNGYVLRLSRFLPRLSPVGLASVSWSLSRIFPQCPKGFVDELVVHSRSAMFQLPPANLTMLVVGLSSMEVDLGEAWLADFKLCARKSFHLFSPLHLSCILRSLGRLNDLPDEHWVRDFLLRTRAQLPRFTSGELAQLLLGLADLNITPEVLWWRYLWSQSRRTLANARMKDWADIALAMVQLKVMPGEVWKRDFLRTCFWKMRYSTSRDLAVILTSMVQLDIRPTPLWLDECSQHLHGQLVRCPPEELAKSIHSIVKLGGRPSRQWLTDFERCSSPILSEFSSQGLADTAWALAELGVQPDLSWLYSFVLAAYQHLDMLEGEDLAQIFTSLTQISPHPRWLDDLVQICASETSGQASGCKGKQQQGEDVLVKQAAELQAIPCRG